MFRNFVDPPSLDRNSLNESQKRASKHVTNLDQSQRSNGESAVSGLNGPQSNDTQVYYHHNNDASSQPHGLNGGYSTSIYVGSKSVSHPPPQVQSNPQQLQQDHYNIQQNQNYPQQNQQHYNHVNQSQQLPCNQNNGNYHSSYQSQSPPPADHVKGQFNNYWSGESHSDSGTDILSLQQAMAAASLHDATYVNGNDSIPTSSRVSQNHNHSSTPGVANSPHPSFPNAAYPPAMVMVAPSHGHPPHPAPARGHALGSINEDGMYGDNEEDAYYRHQQQQQMHSHQHHHRQQQGYTQHQQTSSSRCVPPTRPQQSWGSGWAPPPASSGSNGPVHSVAPPQKRYNVIPPPPPLADSVFAGRRDVKRPSSVQESQIVSEKGTVRGFKNRVRAGIATFWAQPQDPRNFRQLEQGKIVVYATSMSVVRETSERCKSVRHLLQNHMVRYEERDLYMSREIQQELDYRLKQEGIKELRLPHVFADGIHLGGAEELEKLNEAGELRALLNNYQKITVRIMCERCGGYRFVPCDVCHGSKRSLLRNHFTEEFCALRCMHCNESGLKRCDLCRDQQE